MKLSVILGPLTAIIFWLSGTYILNCIQKSSGELYIVLLMTAILCLVCYYIRKKIPSVMQVVIHIVVLFCFLLLEYVTEIISVSIVVFLVIHIIISMIAGAKKLNILDLPKGFHTAVFFIFYAIAFIEGSANLYAVYMLFAAFVVSRNVLNTSVRNEDYIEVISSYSVMDRRELQSGSNRTTIKSGLILAGISIAFGLLGRIGIFNELMNRLKNGIWKIIEAVSALRQSKVNNPVEPEPNIPIEDNTQLVESPDDSGIWAIIGYVCAVIILLYMIFLIIDKINTVRKNKVIMPEFATVTTVSREVFDEKIKKEVKTPDWSHRRSIRRLYRQRIQKGRGKINEDLYSNTPNEHRNKKLNEGIQVSEEFVALYERARYSGESMTREDVKNMKNI